MKNIFVLSRGNGTIKIPSHGKGIGVGRGKGGEVKFPGFMDICKINICKLVLETSTEEKKTVRMVWENGKALETKTIVYRGLPYTKISFQFEVIC